MSNRRAGSTAPACCSLMLLYRPRYLHFFAHEPDHHDQSWPWYVVLRRKWTGPCSGRGQWQFGRPIQPPASRPTCNRSESAPVGNCSGDLQTSNFKLVKLVWNSTFGNLEILYLVETELSMVS